MPGADQLAPACAGFVNQRSRVKLWPLVFSAVVAGGCGGDQRRALIHDSETQLTAGRFRGPVEVRLPERARQPHSWVEIHAELRAACSPLLELRFPDGEVARLGDGDARWQALQRARATHVSTETKPDRPASPRPADGPGSWKRVTTESWPGQLAFRSEREARCAKRHIYKRVHLTALDQTRPLTLWTEVPQELADATLRVKVYEIVDVGERREAEARLRAELTRPPEPRKPRPARPKPKSEKPGEPATPGAVWVSGRWEWVEGRGKWVWISGTWRASGGPPPARVENPGAPPVAGCTWQRGRWVWIPGKGEWKWTAGYWNPPPPKVETRGEPPVPESTWVPGRWVSVDASFEWIAGRWGKPRPRVEARGRPPHPGAVWRGGVWINKGGTWVWSPGRWERQAPPPPKQERRPKRPHPKAVWLAGFWKWSGGRYRWVSGRWEKPPGEGYVWVADPQSPSRGRWVLEIDVEVR